MENAFSFVLSPLSSSSSSSSTLSILARGRARGHAPEMSPMFNTD